MLFLSLHIQISHYTSLAAHSEPSETRTASIARDNNDSEVVSIREKSTIETSSVIALITHLSVVTPSVAPSTCIDICSVDDNSIVNRTKRFLLVDDVPSNRKMLRKLLEQRGHTCDEAEDGLVALNMVRNTANNETSTSYDAILMDFVMPVMNGPDSTRAIRELGYTGAIIGVTYFMNAGLTDIIIKPLRMNKLAEIMEI